MRGCAPAIPGRIRREHAAGGVPQSRDRRIVRRRQQPRAHGSGEVRAFDAATGALRWTFHPLPRTRRPAAPTRGRRSSSTSGNGLVFLPTGSASPDYFGGLRVGQDGYANSIVALRAATGEVVWHFQTVHHDLWDYDVASPPLLYQSKAGPAVAAGSKTGHMFLLDRLTGKPLFPIRNARCLRATSTASARSRRSRSPTGLRRSRLSTCARRISGARPRRISRRAAKR